MSMRPSPSMIRRAALAFAGIAVIGIAANPLDWFVARFAANHAWIDRVVVETADRSHARRFDAAVAAGLIRFDPDAERIVVAPCEALFAPTQAEQAALSESGRHSLEDLCNGGSSNALLDEIAAWNGSFRLLAIRDNRDRSRRCEDGRSVAGPVLPRGCKPPQWTVSMAMADGGQIPIRPVPGATPSPRDFAAVAKARTPWAADWLVAGSSAVGGDAPVRLSTSLSGKARVVVDLVGLPQRIEGDGATHVVSAGVEGRFKVGRLAGSITAVCARRARDPGCADARRRGAPVAYRLAISGADRAAATLSVVARPLETRVPGLASLREAGPGAKSVVVRRTPHIRLACRGGTPAPACELAWETRSATETLARHGYRILSADGRDLVDAAGSLTPRALEIGLAPLVGYGASDVGSLSAGLAAASRTGDRALSLTIDTGVQRVAAAALAEAAERRDAQASSRSALVLIDADGATAGDVLAIVSTPDFAGGLNAWDLEALAAGGEADNPLAGHAWRAGDHATMPGSTFKLVTALAGLDAAIAGDDATWGLLSGAVEPAKVARDFGFPALGSASLVVPGASRANDFTVDNADAGHSFGSDVRLPEVTKCPGTVGRAQIGVCEALITSSNLWFAGLELHLDEARVLDAAGFESDQPTPDLQLAQTLGRLFPLRAPDGHAGQPVMGVDLVRGAVPRAHRLVAEPIRLSAVEPNGARRIALATNAYGQGVTASPLAVASLYASVGAGRVVLPRIVASSDPGTRLDPREGAPLFAADPSGRADAGLAAIRAGLHGVANVKGGTAATSFTKTDRAFRDRLFVKTGTATIGSGRGRYSSWLAGWIEPAPGSGITRRLAFACWVSETAASGARACGQMVREVLTTLDRQSVLPGPTAGLITEGRTSHD